MLQPQSARIRPQNLLQNIAAPQGLMPPPSMARGGAEDGRIAGVSLIAKTFQQINTSGINGVGGNIDLLG